MVVDCESEGLNLAYHRPWEVSFALATLKTGIQSTHTSLIRWPDLNISADAARVTRFNRTTYDSNAKDAREVWKELVVHLMDKDTLILMHSGIGFDGYMLRNWARAIGVAFDWGWTNRLYDTDSLSRAYKKGFKPDRDDMEAWMHRAHNHVERGLKTSVGAMCVEFGIEYDQASAHSASYDVSRQWLIFRELVFKLDI